MAMQATKRVLRAGGVMALASVAPFMLGPAAPRAAPAGPAPKVQALGVAKPQRVLFVGNSYLYYGDSLHNHVRRLALAAGIHGNEQLKYKSITISGGALHQHDVKSYLLPGKLGIEEPFEAVVLQGGSGATVSAARRAEFKQTVKAFDAEIRKAGGQTALYMTHAYVTPHARARPDMLDDIARLYIEVGNEVGALVIPVGIAFAEAYRLRPGLVLHKSFDGSHPDLIGTYLAACVVFASLYGATPVGNSYDYYGRIDRSMATFLQEVAQATVRRFHGR